MSAKNDNRKIVIPAKAGIHSHSCAQQMSSSAVWPKEPVLNISVQINNCRGELSGSPVGALKDAPLPRTPTLLLFILLRLKLN